MHGRRANWSKQNQLALFVFLQYLKMKKRVCDIFYLAGKVSYEYQVKFCRVTVLPLLPGMA